MKKLLLFSLLITLIAFSSFAQTKKDGTPDMRYNSNKGYSGSIFRNQDKFFKLYRFQTSL